MSIDVMVRQIHVPVCCASYPYAYVAVGNGKEYVLC